MFTALEHARPRNDFTTDEQPSVSAHATRSRKAREIMKGQGITVGYDEKVPNEVKTAWVIEKDPDGKESRKVVTHPGGAQLIDVFNAAEHTDRVIEVRLLRDARKGKDGTQAIFPNGTFDNGQVIVPLRGGERVKRPYSNGDKTTYLPAGYYSGTRKAG